MKTSPRTHFAEIARLTTLVSLSAGLLLAAVESQPPPGPAPKFDETKIRQWTRTGPLGETPGRRTEDLPLSDQANTGHWLKFEPMSDEFGGSALDTNKWVVGMSWWKGRQPAWFNPTNVTVSSGQVHLTMRKERVPTELEKLGYHGYTSAALHTRARSSYGYYEVKARPMNSAGSSSFWFQSRFDSETMPDWFGMPEDGDLPSTFSIEYVRAWKKQEDRGSRGSNGRGG